MSEMNDYKLAMNYRDLFIDTYNRVTIYLEGALRSKLDDSENIIYDIKAILEDYRRRLKAIDIGQ